MTQSKISYVRFSYPYIILEADDGKTICANALLMNAVKELEISDFALYSADVVEDKIVFRRANKSIDLSLLIEEMRKLQF